MHKFYEKVNPFRISSVSLADTCRDAEGNVIMNKSGMIERWRKYFDEHLNGDVASLNGEDTDLRVPAAANKGGDRKNDEAIGRHGLSSALDCF